MSDLLGDRMKAYENACKHKLQKKIPVICRIDGRAFHTLTKGMKRPYDTRLHECMVIGAIAVAKQLVGCQIGYTQSDEVSFLITDYINATTQSYFDYKLEKMCSVTASIMTSAFLIAFLSRFPERSENILAGKGLPTFDARFFNVPKEEVNNYFIWRMKDTVRNSVQMLARANFSHKECLNKSSKELQEMLDDKNISWTTQPHWFKYGTGIVKTTALEEILTPKNELIGVERSRWESDLNIPLFWEKPEYIKKYV